MDKTIDVRPAKVLIQRILISFKATQVQKQVCKPTNERLRYKTLGTSMIYIPMSSSFLITELVTNDATERV